MAAGMVHSASRPEYMNATPHHSKLRVTITLSSSLYVAGEELTGKMEMECRADSGVGIGLIMVELFAVQELNSRDHSATSTFLHIRRLFQGPGLPPSNAVAAHPAPGQPPLPQGHFPARRGVTTFFFRFLLPLSSPSAVTFASGLARVRYEVRASISVAHRNEKRVVTDTTDADVVQCADMDGAVSEHVVVGENGKVYVQGRVLGGRLVSGQQGCVELHVKNLSPKKTTGLTLTLTRVLHLHDATASPPPMQLTDTLVTQNFRGAEYVVQPGAEGVATLVFDVPNAARVVKGGLREGAADGTMTAPLFELRCILAIHIGMGIASKDVLFEIPVQLSHPAVLPSRADASPPRAMSPPNPYFARSPEAGSNGSSPVQMYDLPPQAYASPPIPSSPPPHSYASPPLQYATPALYHHPPASYPQQYAWSLPPPNVPYFAPGPDLQHQYYFPPPPVPLVPFAHPARPSSAGAPPPLPSGLPGVGATGPSGLPGVGTVTHAYPPFQSQNHYYAAPNEPTSHHPFPQSQFPPEEQDDAEVAVAEEGKGARASRIAQHLRTSTRARSASPTAHRFPGSAPAPADALQTMHDVPHQTSAALFATAPRNPAVPPVLSPRPVRSPRSSFSTAKDAGAGGTARSGRVDLLERMVDPAPGDEGRSVEEVLRDLEQDKTLPPPPVPSGKARGENVPRARDVFALPPGEIRNDEVTGAPAKKSVLRPSPMARPISMEGTVVQGKRDIQGRGAGLLEPATSGLDALEQRLLYEVGTRKPNKQDRRTVIPLDDTPTSPALAPVSTSPAVALRTTSVPPPLVQHDSEISDLALASHGSAEREFRAASTSGAFPSPTSPRKETQELHAIATRARQRTTSAAREKDNDATREAKMRQHEALKLRKEAKGRVADWLGGMSDPPEKEDGDTAVRSPGDTSDTKCPEINKRSLDETKASTRAVSPLSPALALPKDVPIKTERSKSPKSPVAPEAKSPPLNDKHTTLNAEPLSPKSRETHAYPPRLISSPPLALPKPPALPTPPALVSPRRLLAQEISSKDASQPPTTDVPISDKPLRLPKFLSSPAVPETKYDVRSARGGKGGIATSVAAMWTSLANDRTTDQPIKPLPKPVIVAPVKRPAFLDVGKAKPSPTSTDSPATQPPVTARSGTASPPAETQHPRNMVKSASVPAAVISSHAKPHLSSTASLARPALAVSKSQPPSLVSTLNETREEPKPKSVTPKELAFGQARLKDLIKKYQQGAS